jgi:hypothetical protein
MIDISINEPLTIAIVDTIARDVLGADVAGVSVSDNTWIHLLDDSQANQDIAQAILDNFGALVVTADKTTMIEGDAGPTISCNDALIAGDATVNYVVLLDGDDYASGTDVVTVGIADLTLASPVAGVYEIFLYRTSGNYASGSVTITVTPP